MNDSFSLDDRRLQAAMAVLEREQRAFLPSQRELVQFRLFNAAIVLAVAFFFLALLDEVFGLGLSLRSEAVVVIGFLALPAVAVVLFLLNIPLIYKLWRQRRLRHQLGLTRGLKPFFKRERRSLYGVLNTIVTLTLVVVAAVGLLLLGAFVHDLLTDPTMREDFGVWGILFMVLLLFFIPVCLISLVLMMKAKERLEVVTKLQRELSERVQAVADKGAGPEISSGAVQMIAEIERSHIIRDRMRSLREGTKKRQAPEYTVQESRVVQQAKINLDAATGRKVEREIFALIENPRPEGVEEDPETGFSTLKVRETSLEIAYRVEEETRRIKIFHLRPAEKPEAGAGSHA